MSARHTPGPWQWDGHTLRPVEPDPSKSHVYSILDADGGYGFFGRDDISEVLAELDADRALIAAAPELLAASSYALEVLNRNRGKQARLRAIERLQAAIAKAPGAPS